ncbi:MAG: hypothetical protein V1667_01710 [bacterium]
MTKQFKITLVILLIASAALFLGNYYFQKWVDFKMAKVSIGLAESKFPYREYTQEELNKMYPQIRYADVPTRTTPEQTYSALKQALKNEDVEAAVNCFIEEKRGEWRENLKKIKEKGFMQEMEQDLTELKLELEGEARMQYSYSKVKDDKIYGYYIDFIKDINGDWKIESL